MRYLYKLALTSILVIIFSSCYGQRKKLDCLISEVNKLQNDFFRENKCNKVSTQQLLYFADKERTKNIKILQEKFAELKYIKKQENIFLIESNYNETASFYNFLIVNDNVYTYHLLYGGKEMKKIPIDEFISDSLENIFVVIDILTHKNALISNLPEPGTREVYGGGCFFVTQITWNTKKPNFKMALFEEYSSFK